MSDKTNHMMLHEKGRPPFRSVLPEVVRKLFEYADGADSVSEEELIVEGLMSGQVGVYRNVVLHEEPPGSRYYGIEMVGFHPDAYMVDVSEHHRSCALRAGGKECTCG